MDKFEVKDHSVSGQKFELIYDEKYAMYRTEPKPSEAELSSYYESEEYISHTDSRSSLKDKLYQYVKKRMLQWKLELLEKQNNKGKLLDLGAGTGDFLGVAKKNGWKIKGVEPNLKAAALAKEKGIVLEPSIADIDEQFDVITMWHVLEHVYYLEEYISFLKRSLSEDGTLYIAVPNYESADAKKYGAFWAAYDVPRHLYHFSKKSIQRLFEEKGMELVGTKPLIFDSFYVSLLSEFYKTGKYRYAHAFWSGLHSNRSARQTGQFSSLIYVLKHLKN